MRSSVPCSNWIDSFSLLDIQVGSPKRDYYVSLVCQVDFVRNNPPRKEAVPFSAGNIRPMHSSTLVKPQIRSDVTSHLAANTFLSLARRLQGDSGGENSHAK
jgi:hypothetical protein